MHPPGLGILLILGIGVFGGVLGAWLFQRLRIPQVIGYIAIGLLLGPSGLGILHQQNLTGLRPFSFLALAVIGFLVGGELESKTFRQYGKQFIGITLGEGITAFLLVGTAIATLFWLLTGDLRTAMAAGLVFGAISAATDPASTMDVLWENRAKGMLTTNMISVIALDDALALLLYTLATAAAVILAGTEASLLEMAGYVAMELLGSALLGSILGLVLDRMLRHVKSMERAIPLMIGALLLLAGTCLYLHLDVILSAMTAGIIMVNRSPARTHSLFKTLREFASPIQVMFFVLVGAQMHLGNTPLWIWGLAGIYVLGSLLGKYGGCWFGARLSGSDPVVRQNLGLGLFAQGGVAVGLSMMAAQHLSGIQVPGGPDLGTVIVATVTTTTLILQILGPPCTKWALTRAGETGRNVTEEDIIDTLTVGDLLNTQPVLLPDATLLSEVISTLSRESQLAFPVVNQNGQCTGVISMESLKSLFAEQDVWDWMIAGDVMSPIQDLLRPDMPLQEGLRNMRQIDAEQTVVRDPRTQHPLGLFDLRQARRDITRRMLTRQGLAAANN